MTPIPADDGAHPATKNYQNTLGMPGEIPGLQQFPSTDCASAINLTIGHKVILENLHRQLWNGRIDNSDNAEAQRQIRELLAWGLLLHAGPAGYVKLSSIALFDQDGNFKAWIDRTPPMRGLSKASLEERQRLHDKAVADEVTRPPHVGRQITSVQYLIARLKAQQPLTLSQPTRHALLEVQTQLKLPDLDASVATCAALGAALMEFIESNATGSWLTVVDAEQETQVRIVLQ